MKKENKNKKYSKQSTCHIGSNTSQDTTEKRFQNFHQYACNQTNTKKIRENESQTNKKTLKVKKEQNYKHSCNL